MFKILGSSFRPETKLSKEWLRILKMYSNPKAQKQLKDQSPKFIQKLGEILLNEDKQTSSNIGPCLELCITQKIFSILTQMAQSHADYLMSEVLKLFFDLLSGSKNQYLFLQMEFHSAILHLLVFLQVQLENEISFVSSIPNLILLLSEITKSIEKYPEVVEMYLNLGEFIPGSLIFKLFPNYFQDLKDTAMALTGITDSLLFHTVKSDFGLVLIHKLCSIFESTKDESRLSFLKTFVQYIDEIYKCTVWPTLRISILNKFYDEFLLILVTPRLQSTDLSQRISTLNNLYSVSKNLSASALVIQLVYYLVGKGKKGERIKTPIIPMYKLMVSHRRRTSSCELETQSTRLDLTSIWRIVIDSLSSSNEQLSISAYKLVYSVIDKRIWEAVKLIVCDSFKGNLKSENIDPEKLIATFDSLLEFKSKEIVTDYLVHGSLYSSRSFVAADNNEFAYDFDLVSEGEFLECLHKGLVKLFENSLEKNLLITGIVAVLASFPIFDSQSRTLHAIIYQTADFNSFVLTMKSLNTYINVCITKDPSFRNTLANVYDVLDESNKTVNQLSDRYTEKDKRVLEACVLLQEFAKELYSVLLYKELSQQMITEKLNK